MGSKIKPEYGVRKAGHDKLTVFHILLAATVCILSLNSEVRAVEYDESGNSAGQESIFEQGRLGLGFGYTYPYSGGMVRYFISDNLGLEAGYIPSWLEVSGFKYEDGYRLRGIYKFDQPDPARWSPYFGRPYIGVGYHSLGAKWDLRPIGWADASIKAPSVFVGLERDTNVVVGLCWFLELGYGFTISEITAQTDHPEYVDVNMIMDDMVEMLTITHPYAGFNFGGGLIYYFGRKGEIPKPFQGYQGENSGTASAPAREEPSRLQSDDNSREMVSRREAELEREIADLRLEIRDLKSRIPPEKTAVTPVVKRAIVTETRRTRYGCAVANPEWQNMLPEEAERVIDALRDEIGQVTNLSVMPKEAMDNTAQQEGITAEACAAEDCARSLGKALKVRRVLFGTLSRDAEAYYLSIFVFNTETGASSYGGAAKGYTVDELAGDVRDLATRIKGKL